MKDQVDLVNVWKTVRLYKKRKIGGFSSMTRCSSTRFWNEPNTWENISIEADIAK